MNARLLAKQRKEEAAYAEQHAIEIDREEYKQYLAREARRRMSVRRGIDVKEGMCDGENEHREERRAAA